MHQGLARNLCLALLSAALASGCADKKEAATGGSEVVAKVNGVALTADQVNHALQRLPQLDANQPDTSLKAVRSLVDQEVIAQKALSDRLDAEPEVVQALDAARRQVLVEAYMGRKLAALAEPGESEIQAYFNEHPELFSERKLYRLQEISIKAPPEKHEAIRKQLDASKSLNDFAAWLKTEELPAMPAQGVKAAEQLPLEMLPRLAKLSVGQGMVANAAEGLLVIVLTGVEAQPVTLEQATPAITRALKAMARQTAVRAELETLKTAAQIEYLGAYADAAKADAKPEAGAETAPASQETQTSGERPDPE